MKLSSYNVTNHICAVVLLKFVGVITALRRVFVVIWSICVFAKVRQNKWQTHLFAVRLERRGGGGRVLR